jgi:hypothetical protein
MQFVDITTDIILRDVYDTLNEVNNNQVLITLDKDVTHYHSLRYAENKLVLITKNTTKEYLNYYVSLTNYHAVDHNSDLFNNETSFTFGGAESSVYQFSNLTFRADFDHYFFEDKKLPEKHSLDPILGNGIESNSAIKFMDIWGNNNKLLFFNCKFINETKKKFEIYISKESIVQFVNCVMMGEFVILKRDNV